MRDSSYETDHELGRGKRKKRKPQNESDLDDDDDDRDEFRTGKKTASKVTPSTKTKRTSKKEMKPIPPPPPLLLHQNVTSQIKSSLPAVANRSYSIKSQVKSSLPLATSESSVMKNQSKSSLSSVKGSMSLLKTVAAKPQGPTTKALNCLDLFRNTTSVENDGPPAKVLSKGSALMLSEIQKKQADQKQHQDEILQKLLQYKSEPDQKRKKKTEQPKEILHVGAEPEDAAIVLDADAIVLDAGAIVLDGDDMVLDPSTGLLKPMEVEEDEKFITDSSLAIDVQEIDDESKVSEGSDSEKSDGEGEFTFALVLQFALHALINSSIFYSCC